MTQAKKLKKAIRARSRKTGESYTAARRHVLKLGVTAPPPKPTPKKPAPSPRGSVTDAVSVRKTGRGLAHWFAVLDSFGAPAKGHTAAARHLFDEHGVPGWYCQGITVAYERARGLRAMNQTCAGTFEVSVTRSLPVPVAEVVAAVSDSRRRRQWLRGADAGLARALEAALGGADARTFKVRDANLARLRYKWDGTGIEFYVAGKPKGGSSLTAANTRLRDAEQVEERRALWKPVLDALKQHLTP